MKLEIEVLQADPAQIRVIVTLSRRNLLAMLHKIDMPGSARTIEKDFGYPTAMTLRLRCEDDAEHYLNESGSETVAGYMHHETEAFIAAAPPTMADLLGDG